MPYDKAQSPGIGFSIRNVGRRQHTEVPICRLPVTVADKGSLSTGLYIAGFALLWICLSIVGMIINGPPDLSRVENWLILLLLAIAFGIFLFGLRMLRWRKTITLDGLFVTVEERGLFGSGTWQEPLTAYQGVMSDSRRVSTEHSSYTVYTIELTHPDRRRNINLYTSYNERGWRRKWEDYARWLKLPALQQGADSLVARDSEDLDKPVEELIREGKLEVKHELLREPTEGLTVDIEGETIVVTRTGRGLPTWAALMFVAIPLIFVYVGFFLEVMPGFIGWIFGGAGLLFGTASISFVIWDLVSRQRLRVGPRQITVNAIGPGGETKGESMAFGEIEEITVSCRKGESSGTKLLIIGDHQSLSFGDYVPRASLDFLENLVLAKIAKHRDSR